MITLHCGLHKTGTSSVQLALKSARLPRRTSIITPAPGDGHLDDDFIHRLQNQVGKGDVVVSHEGLLGDAFDGYQAAPGRLRQVHEALDGSPYRIILYLRHNLSWLTSIYMQAIQGGSTTDPEDFWNSLRYCKFLFWSKLVSLILDTSGARQVLLRSFDSRSDVVDDFFSCLELGKPPRIGPQGFRENQSIWPVQAPLLRALNARNGLDLSQAEANRRLFQVHLSLGAPRYGSPFPESVQRDIQDQYRSDWLALAQMVSSLDPEEATRFEAANARFSEEPKEFVGQGLSSAITQEEAIRSLQWIANTQRHGRRGPFARAYSKFSSDPLGVPSAMGRAVRNLGKK